MRPFLPLALTLLLAGCSHLASPGATALQGSRIVKAAAKDAGHVRGIGGLFLRAANPAAQCAWYSQHLGLAAKPDEGTYFVWQLPGSPQAFSTMWFLFPAATTYFNGPCMINYVVDDLAALLARLKAEGVDVEPKTVNDEGGKFGWAYDGDGNKIELFEPAIAVTPLPHDHVLGIGGLALKSANQPAQAAWYARHLGIEAGGRFAWELPGGTRLSTSWNVLPAATAPFNGPCMVSYVVDDLKDVLGRLKADGVQVEPKTATDARGTTGWAYDGAGEKLELWEPAKPLR